MEVIGWILLILVGLPLILHFIGLVINLITGAGAGLYIAAAGDDSESRVTGFLLFLFCAGMLGITYSCLS